MRYSQTALNLFWLGLINSYCSYWVNHYLRRNCLDITGFGISSNTAMLYEEFEVGHQLENYVPELLSLSSFCWRTSSKMEIFSPYLHTFGVLFNQTSYHILTAALKTELGLWFVGEKI